MLDNVNNNKGRFKFYQWLRFRRVRASFRWQSRTFWRRTWLWKASSSSNEPSRQYQSSEKRDLLQWTLLYMITVYVISLLLRSNWQIFKSQITLNNVVYKSKIFAYCYRLVNVISDSLAQPVITLSSLCYDLKTF